MKIKIIQNSVGRFYFGSTEESLSFSIGIFEDNKVVEIDGVKCIASYSTSEDPDYVQIDFEREFENGDIDDIIYKCLKMSFNKISTRNYLSECYAFIEMYSKNREHLYEQYKKDKIEQIEKQIIELQTQKETVEGRIVFDTLYETEDLLESKSNSCNKSIDYNITQREDCKKNSKMYNEYQSHIDSYEKSKEKIKKIIELIKVNDEN